MEFDEKKRPDIKISGIVLDCPDAESLANFYQRLLGWKMTHCGNGWAGLTAPDGVVLAFQSIENYTPPVWPWEENQQGQMLHLDFLVNDLEQAVDFAVSCGARLADAQYFTTSQTLLDPAGHPFCLDTREDE